MTPADAAPPRGETTAPAAGTRRRDDVLLRAILAATLAELAEHGYRGVTFEGVARRAQTSKPVIYRRYTTRAELILAALSALDPLPTTAARTGELRAELLALFELHKERYNRLGAGAVRGLLAELPQERSVDMLAIGAEAMIPAVRELVELASGRGELGPRPVPETVVALPLALLRYEFLTLGRVPPRPEIERMLDEIYLPLLRLHSGAA